MSTEAYVALLSTTPVAVQPGSTSFSLTACTPKSVFWPSVKILA